MEKTDKSAKDILCKYETYVKYSDVPIFLEENVLKAMHEYAAQQLSEYKEVIKELLPFARSVVYNTSISTEEGRKNVREIQVVIDRAKKLID